MSPCSVTIERSTLTCLRPNTAWQAQQAARGYSQRTPPKLALARLRRSCTKPGDSGQRNLHSMFDYGQERQSYILLRGFPVDPPTFASLSTRAIWTSSTAQSTYPSQPLRGHRNLPSASLFAFNRETPWPQAEQSRRIGLMFLHSCSSYVAVSRTRGNSTLVLPMGKI